MFESCGSNYANGQSATRVVVKYSLTTEFPREIARSVMRPLFWPEDLGFGSGVRLVDGLGSGDGGIQTGELRGIRCRGLAIGLVLAGNPLTRARQPLLDSARKISLPVELDLRVSLGHPYRAVAGCTSDRAKNLPEFKQIQYSDHTTSA